MTLKQLVDVICTKTGLNETEDRAACATFLTQRHRMVYDDALWKDSLREFEYVTTLNGLRLSATSSPGYGHITASSLDAYTDTYPITIDYVKSINDVYGRIRIPFGADRVVAVRSAGQHLNVQSRESFYRTDCDRYYNSGTPCDFFELPASVMSVPFPQAWHYKALLSDSSDNNTPLTIKYAQANGMIYTDVFELSSSIQNTIYHDTGLSFLAKPYVYENSSHYVRGRVKKTAQYLPIDSSVGFITSAVWNIYTSTTGTGTPDSNPSEWVHSVTNNSTNKKDTFTDDYTNVALAMYIQGTYVICRYTFDGLDSPWSDVYQVNSGQSVYPVLSNSNYYLLDILSISKPTTKGVVYVGRNGASTYPEVILTASDTVAPASPMIQLSNPPSADITLRILVKMKCPQFDSDTHESGLRNLENCLMAFATADMLEYDHQYGKAQMIIQEASALLQKLKELESVQAASNQTIVPETGFGNAIQSNRSGCYY